MSKHEFYEGRSRKNPMSGVEHLVYNDTEDPSIVYKIGSKESIDQWYNIFKKNPNIFPKIYGRGKTRIKAPKILYLINKKKVTTVKKGDVFNADYVVMEKLNTQKVHDEWEILDNTFSLAYEEVAPNYSEMDFLEFVASYISLGKYDKLNVTVLKKVKEINPENYSLTLKYTNLIDKIKELKEVPDLHFNNFGYSEDGTLKCLDF